MRDFLTCTAITEATRNVVTQIRPTLIAVGVTSVAAFLLVSITAVEVGSMASRHRDAVLAGSNVLSITAANRTWMPAAQCEELGRVPGVISAGGFIARGAVQSTVLPGRAIPYVEVTPGLPAIFWPENVLSPREGRSVVSGAELGKELGLVPGAVLTGSDEAGSAVVVDQVAGRSPRASFFDSLIAVVGSPTEAIDECLVEAEDGARIEVEAVATAWFPSHLDTKVAPFSAELMTRPTLEGEITTRISSWAPAVAFFVIACAIVSSWITRRAELALYYSLGMSGRRMLVMLATECLLLGAMPFWGAVGVALCVQRWDDVTLQIVAGDIVRCLLLMALLPLAGMLITPRSKAIETIGGR